MSLQPPTPPPLYVLPEPVASHPVQVTTTTDDSEKALLVCNYTCRTLYIVCEHLFYSCTYTRKCTCVKARFYGDLFTVCV